MPPGISICASSSSGAGALCMKAFRHALVTAESSEAIAVIAARAGAVISPAERRRRERSAGGSPGKIATRQMAPVLTCRVEASPSYPAFYGPWR